MKCGSSKQAFWTNFPEGSQERAAKMQSLIASHNRSCPIVVHFFDVLDVTKFKRVTLNKHILFFITFIGAGLNLSLMLLEMPGLGFKIGPN